MDVYTVTPTPENTRRMLVVAAAHALAIGPQLSQEIAGVDTAKWVQSARAVYKAQGFTFSDDDLREIQHILRAVVANRAARGELPVMDVAPNGLMIERPRPVTPEIKVTESDGRTYTIDKDRKVF